MPQVVAGAALSAAFSTAASFTFASFATSFATSLALGGLSTLLQKQGKSSQGATVSEGITRQFRSATSPREVVYGEVRKSGTIAVVSNSSDSLKFRYIIMLATHEIEGVDEFIIDDISVPLDALDVNGNVTSGVYADKLKLVVVNKGETALSDAVSAIPEWTTSHVLNDIAYIYAELDWDRTVWVNGVPTISCWLRGKKVIDIRDIQISEERITEDGETRVTEDDEIRVTESQAGEYPRAWSPNIGLQTIDNLIDPDWGFKVDINDVNLDTSISCANLCDEMVQTLSVTHEGESASGDIISVDGDILMFFRGDRVQVTNSTITGLANGVYYVIPYQRYQEPRIRLASTLDDAMLGNAVTLTSDGTCDMNKTGEPRYHGGGVLKMDQGRKSNMESIISGMGGVVSQVGLQWNVKGASYEAPVYSFDERDLVGGVQVYQTSVSRRDRFNQVQGKYITQIFNGNEADYPLVQSSTYIERDGETLKVELDLPFTQRPQTAQRIAKTAMERARQAIKFKTRLNMVGWKVRVGDNIYFSFNQLGWSNKVFEIVSWKSGTGSDGAPYVEIDCHENASAVYDFTSASDETTVDPAPNTNLRSPRDVEPVGLFSLDSIPVTSQSGDTSYKIAMSWDYDDDAYVSSGGQFHIQYKRSTDVEYTFNVLLDGSARDTELFQSQIDVLYDVRIRAINNLGAESVFSTVTGFIAGSSLVADSQDFENDTGLSAEDYELDTGLAEDWENDS